MTSIPSGFNYSTKNATGIAFDICWTVDTTVEPEYPLPPFLLGTRCEGLDNSTWVFAKPAAPYSIGTVGYFDKSWNFIAVTTTNAANMQGRDVGVLSQISSVTTPTPTNYDAVWVQTKGITPALNVAASTVSFSTLYPSSIPGQLTSTFTGLAIINMVTVTTASSAGNYPGIIS